MKNCVNFMLPQAPLNIIRTRNVTMFEGEVGTLLQYPRIVKCCAIIWLVERHYIVPSRLGTLTPDNGQTSKHCETAISIVFGPASCITLILSPLCPLGSCG